MGMFPRIRGGSVFRGGSVQAGLSGGSRTVASAGKASGIGSLAGLAAMFAFIEPANRGLNQGTNAIVPNALPDIQTLARLSWTNPENRDYWKALAKTWGYDHDNFDEILRASARWPTVDEILQAGLLGVFGNDDKYRFPDKNGVFRELGFDDFLRGAQVPHEFDAFFRLLKNRPIPLESAVKLVRRYGDYFSQVDEGGTQTPTKYPAGGKYFDLFQAAKRSEGLDVKSDETIFKAFQVHPGISDVIRFAVREVYTPEIARRFGQFDDLPEDFMTEARKVGLNKEDSARFWAAHWELPSIQQGFEMLHRGVIDEDELQVLLRAQDVMPFWREKLTRISYRPIRLVDIYRLYEQRVIPRIDPDNLDRETPLVKRFMTRGYTFEDAKSLSLWLDRTRPDPATEATIKTVVETFKDGLIEENEFLELLSDLKLAKATETFLISSSKVERNKRLLDVAIKRLSPLLRDGSVSESEFKAELRKYGLAEAAIDRVIDRIESEQADKKRGLSESQVLRLYGKGLIETDKEALSRLMASGRTSSSAALLLKEAKKDRESGSDSVPFADMKGFLASGAVDDVRFTAYCEAKGMPSWAIALYIDKVQGSPAGEDI